MARAPEGALSWAAAGRMRAAGLRLLVVVGRVLFVVVLVDLWVGLFLCLLRWYGFFVIFPLMQLGHL